MKKWLNSLQKWEKIWIPLSLVLIVIAWFLEYFLTPIEERDTTLWQIIYFVSTITGMLCVVLTSGKRWSQWIVGLVNIVGFVALYYHWQVYGNFILNLVFYIPASITGIVMWLKHRDSEYTCEVKQLSKKNKIILTVVSIVSLVVIAFPLSYFDRDSKEAYTLIGFLDSAGTVLGVIGQVLLNFRYTEQWWIWIILDIVMTVLNAIIGSYALSMMYLLWTINAVIGLIVWKKSSEVTKNA